MQALQTFKNDNFTIEYDGQDIQVFANDGDKSLLLNAEMTREQLRELAFMLYTIGGAL